MKMLMRFLLCVIFMSSLVRGGTTGKIRGMVTDRNGDPLPGANVVVEGTTLGASTSLAGEYIILLVPPGLHTINVSMMGFKSSVTNDVKVEIDRTITIDFVL
ncbi:carboxypeptidase-like regulatory domain-containing protein, partial [candidate division KSB1 bacterium]|nr:carboxypeptidase-like regulatory domain-containing protein [candidate division KSB1 bacterium]